MEFYKYQGTGNDFVMIDNRKGAFNSNDLDLVRKMCQRRFGIGADGLILIQNHPDFDFEMVYYNADGSQSLCGNGSRCAVDFANFLGIIKDKATFLAIDGPHEAFMKEGLIYLKMGDVKLIENGSDHYFVNTGSPHYVKYVKDIKTFDVFNEGRKIRNSEKYRTAGTNVNFVETAGGNEIFARTYERGVEDETLSCGTGVTACALVASVKGMQSPVKVNTRGGELQVSFKKEADNHYTDIYLIGPAVKVYAGQFS